jgi:hypothetical protein
MTKMCKPEYLTKVQHLSKEETERLLSRMAGKLPRRLEKDKLSREEALAIQIELEDEQLQEWRKNMQELKKKEEAKAAANKSKVAAESKVSVKKPKEVGAVKAITKTKAVVKSKTAAKPKTTVKAQTPEKSKVADKSKDE